MIQKKNHIQSKALVLMVSGVLMFSFEPFVSFAQCAGTIVNFPYSEDFETTNGNWVVGGNSPDWAWGTPQKPVINKAGKGLKCWITGGLNKPAYNSGENAWLKSPCFDFTNIAHPHLKFKVFWETEGEFDGANIQYSIDGGNTWQIPGNITDAPNCLNGNWFNYATFGNLGGKNAWSGNVQPSGNGCVIGGGSGGWVTAQHTLPYLAGKSNVIFRFVFASGTTCNDFDGFAVDDIAIGEAPPNVASFNYTCSNNNTVNFNNASNGCPTSYLWDFGEASSGINNTSTLANPVHSYIGGGTFIVKLTVNGPDNASSTVTTLVSILSVVPKILTPILCPDGNTGSVIAEYTGTTNTYNYSWNSVPVQNTQTAINLGAGTYIVTVTGNDVCPVTAAVSLTEPAAFSHSITTVNPTCNKRDGSIKIVLSGGTLPYSYNWLPNVSNTNSANGLAAGIYTITINDKNLCGHVIDANLVDASGLQANVVSSKNVSCYGANDGMAAVLAVGGSLPYSYSWSPIGGNNDTANDLAGGTYNATVKDANGCITIAAVVISEPSAMDTKIISQNTSCGNSDGSALVEVTGGIGPYTFSWNPGDLSGTSVIGLDSGLYMVTVKDTNGCVKTDNAFIASSTPVLVNLLHEDVDCFGNNSGSAIAKVTGGTTPYSIIWTNETQSYSGDSIGNVGAGTYIIVVNDADVCSRTDTIIIIQPSPFELLVATTPSSCNQNNGTAAVMVSGATAPYSYLWQNNLDTTSFLTNLSPGFYPVTITDKNNCVASTGAAIENANPLKVFLGNDTTICTGDRIILSPGNFIGFTWQDNAVTPTYTVTQEGTYTVLVNDGLGCTASDTIKIIADCGDIFFPTAFTPNNDMRNDLFGPLGDLSKLTYYSLMVYNRWGQMVFETRDPFKKWDGKPFTKNPQAATFVWIAKFTNKEQKNIVRKGTVTMVY